MSDFCQLYINIFHPITIIIHTFGDFKNKAVKSQSDAHLKILF